MTTKLHKSAVFAVAVALLATSSPAADNDVLYWMVDSSSATVSSGSGDPSSLTDFLSGYGQPADSSFAARVRVTGGDISGDTFLDLYYPNNQGDYSLELGDLGVDLGDFSTTGMQSPLGAYGSPEYSFIVEIGNVVWSDSSYSSGSWTETLAVSAATSYASLANYISQIGSTGLPQSAIWNTTQFTAVPEPSSGMLAIMGFALLALRRRKHVKGA